MSPLSRHRLDCSRKARVRASVPPTKANLATLLVCLLLCACGKSDSSHEPDPDAGHDAATDPSVLEHEDLNDPLERFEPELLASGDDAESHLVLLPRDDLPRLEVVLQGRPSYKLELRIAAECANAAAVREIERRPAAIVEAVRHYTAKQTPRFLHSVEGKLAFKEALVYVLRQQLPNRLAIRRVYFYWFVLRPYRREQRPAAPPPVSQE